MSDDRPDDGGGDGERPHEEVGPEECDAKPEESEFGPGELDGKPEEAQFSVVDEVHEMMATEPIQIMRDPVDGLPRPVDPGTHPYAPPFTRLHVNCLADDRKYVELWADELVTRWPRRKIDKRSVLVPPGYTMVHHVMRKDAGKVEIVFDVRHRYDNEGAEQQRREYDPDVVVSRYGQYVVPGKAGGLLIAVRPRREKCQFYRRQLFNIDGDESGHDPFEEGGKIQFKNCTKRRSIGGAHMSLSGQAIYACDYREPPDPLTVERFLDETDRKALDDKRHLTMVPAFGMAGESYQRDDIDDPKEGISN